MNPDNSSHGGDVPANVPPGTSVPPADTTPQAAATTVLRSQIDAIYGSKPRSYGHRPSSVPHTPAAPSTGDVPTEPSPYHRTHSAHPQPQAEQWKQYHSAWQNYYQKYYEGYYAHQAAQTQSAPASGYFSNQPEPEPTPEEISSDEALVELRQKLLGKVQASAQKVRRSRHFVPIVAAVVVVLVFVFLQYNRVIFANVSAYVSPGSIDPQNIVVDPTSDIAVSNEPRLIIPKINVDVPVMYDVGADHNSQMKAMEKGVAHFSIAGASSHPGEIGNTVIAGHSSNDLFDTGDYKFIFAQLERLKKGDTIYANYKGKRYTYVVTKTETVKPTEVNKLIYHTTKPVMTLITCTPLGTALNRFLVTAEQVSPDPAGAKAAPTLEDSEGEAEIPGNSPTFFERLFGAN